ncbi:hypothetical protein Halar_2909 [halophilic archaeon DL31]|jgi:hypothetical protein|nr:hypothetical protein Halar_2909 [halophilic archaeon DL31]
MRREYTVFVLSALVGVAVFGGTVLAVTVPVLPMHPVEMGSATTINSTDLGVDSHRLTYTSENVSGVGVVVNNTGTGTHTGDVRATLRDINGAVVASATITGTSFPAGTTTVTLTFSASYSTGTFSAVAVTVESTG